MNNIEGNMHEIRRRFVQGLLLKMPPQLLMAYVTGNEDAKAEERSA